MSVIRFPFEAESEHPLYKWNEHEFIVRMLTQNQIGIAFTELETGTPEVSITSNSMITMNHIAHGGHQFSPHSGAPFVITTTQTRWIYIDENGSSIGIPSIYPSPIRPVYNSILHGWYHPAEPHRALFLIDPDQPQGYRTIVMDSFNSMFDFDYSIPDPDSGSTPFYKAEPPFGNVVALACPPGKYVFEVRGGKGGKGGDNNPGMPTYLPATYGGAGASAPILRLKLRIVE